MATVQQFFDNLPDLRNGDPSNYVIVHVAAGIDNHYHSFLPNDCPVDRTDMSGRIRLIASHYASRIAAAGADAADARAQGLVLACVREGIYASWAITDADMIASQTVANHIWHYDEMAQGDDRVTNAGVRTHYAEYTADVLTEDLMYSLARLGMGMLPCTGVVLVKTDNQHHYVEPHKTVHKAVLNQVLGRNYVVPLGMERELFEDLACHKAAHCILTSVAVAIARNHDTKVRLDAAKLGSAAVRIPALYGYEAAAGAILKVAKVAQAVGATANVAMNITALEARVARIYQTDSTTPTGRTTGAARQAGVVEDFCEDIAFCAGMIRASSSHAGQAAPAILKAWSIKTIVSNCTASVTRGSTHMEQAFAVARARARRGIIPGVGIFGAATPADTDPLPADETLAQVLSAVLGGGANTPAPVMPAAAGGVPR